MSQLTANSINDIIAGGEGTTHTDFQPIMQVLDIKRVTTSVGQTPRYRALLTDSSKSIPAMIATQNNEVIDSGVLAVNSIIRLCEYTFNNLGGQSIIILLVFTVLGSGQPIAPAETARPSAPAPPLPAPAQAPAPPARPPAAPSPYSGQGAYGGYGGATNSRPVVRENPDCAVMPISSLNPYTNRWTIKARITNKSEIRRWSNAKGEGMLFNIELLDATGGEIRGTFFKENCEKWFPILELHKVYTFSGGQLKVADRKFNNLKSDYEISFNSQTDIRPVAEDDSSIKHIQYHFTKVGDLANAAVNATVDVLVVVRAASECSELISQKLGGKVLFKRDLTVYDSSGSECRLTLWGEKAQADTDLVGHILAFKAVRVGDYNGRNLSVGNNSHFEVDPDIPEAHELYSYKESTGTAELTSLSTAGAGAGGDSFDKRKTISSIRDEGMGMGEKPDYVGLKASVSYIKHDTDCWYTACPAEGCNKKVNESMNGNWNCEKCNKEYPNCQRRYVLSVTMADDTGASWFSLFNDTAQLLLGKTAEELSQMKLAGDDAGYEEVFGDALFKSYVTRARVKQEPVNDELRVKSSLMTLQPVNYVQESKSILDAIRKYN